jgi:hypothetical protein
MAKINLPTEYPDGMTEERLPKNNFISPFWGEKKNIDEICNPSKKVELKLPKLNDE